MNDGSWTYDDSDFEYKQWLFFWTFSLYEEIKPVLFRDGVIRSPFLWLVGNLTDTPLKVILHYYLRTNKYITLCHCLATHK